MAIKLIANYSKRLGLPGYSSHQFSVSVETELRDITEADTEMENLYHQLQRNVDTQIQETGFVPSESYGSQPSSRQAPQQKPQPQASNGSTSDDWACSPKQAAFVRRLMEENNLPITEIDDLAHRRFGRPAKRLDKMQASGLIDALLDKYSTN
jgi:hypothetical protein